MKDYFLTFLHPKKAFEILLNDQRYFQLAFVYMLIPITGYTLLYVFLTIAHGAPSVFTPWLNISAENYYAINRFLLAPSIILCWFTSTATVQVLARLVGGRGSFEQTLSVLALSISIAMWGGLLHDLPMGFLSAVGIINAQEHEIAMNSPTVFRTLLWSCYSIYFVLFLILFPLGVQVVHQLSKVKSGLIGMVGFTVFQLIFLIFNR